MTSNWKRVDEIVERVKGELDNADIEFEKLNHLVLEELGHFESLINDPDQLARDEAVDFVDAGYAGNSLSSPEQGVPDRCDKPVLEPIREKEISHLNEKDGPGLEDQQSQSSLLKRAHENLEELTQTADRKFTSVFESLEAAETKANERMQHQKKKRERVAKKLFIFKKSLKDLLKAQWTQSGV